MFLLSQANDGGKAGIWRILDIFQRNDVTATIDVNGLAVQKWPECIKALHEQGSQITGHGTTNDLKLTELTPDQQREEIRPVSHIIREVTGSVPVGWVSPRQPLSFTPSLVARPHMAHAFEKMIQYCKAHEDIVWFPTREELARHVPETSMQAEDDTPPG